MHSKIVSPVQQLLSISQQMNEFMNQIPPDSASKVVQQINRNAPQLVQLKLQPEAFKQVDFTPIIDKFQEYQESKRQRVPPSATYLLTPRRPITAQDQLSGCLDLSWPQRPLSSKLPVQSPISHLKPQVQRQLVGEHLRLRFNPQKFSKSTETILTRYLEPHYQQIQMDNPARMKRIQALDLNDNQQIPDSLPSKKYRRNDRQFKGRLSVREEVPVDPQFLDSHMQQYVVDLEGKFNHKQPKFRAQSAPVEQNIFHSMVRKQQRTFIIETQQEKQTTPSIRSRQAVEQAKLMMETLSNRPKTNPDAVMMSKVNQQQSTSKFSSAMHILSIQESNYDIELCQLKDDQFLTSAKSFVPKRVQEISQYDDSQDYQLQTSASSDKEAKKLDSKVILHPNSANELTLYEQQQIKKLILSAGDQIADLLLGRFVANNVNSASNDYVRYMHELLFLTVFGQTDIELTPFARQLKDNLRAHVDTVNHMVHLLIQRSFYQLLKPRLMSLYVVDEFHSQELVHYFYDIKFAELLTRLQLDCSFFDTPVFSLLHLFAVIQGVLGSRQFINSDELNSFAPVFRAAAFGAAAHETQFLEGENLGRFQYSDKKSYDKINQVANINLIRQLKLSKYLRDYLFSVLLGDFTQVFEHYIAEHAPGRDIFQEKSPNNKIYELDVPLATVVLHNMLDQSFERQKYNRNCAFLTYGNAKVLDWRIADAFSAFLVLRFQHLILQDDEKCIRVVQEYQFLLYLVVQYLKSQCFKFATCRVVSSCFEGINLSEPLQFCYWYQTVVSLLTVLCDNSIITNFFCCYQLHHRQYALMQYSDFLKAIVGEMLLINHMLIGKDTFKLQKIPLLSMNSNAKGLLGMPHLSQLICNLNSSSLQYQINAIPLPIQNQLMKVYIHIFHARLYIQLNLSTHLKLSLEHSFDDDFCQGRILLFLQNQEYQQLMEEYTNALAGLGQKIYK